MRRERDGEEHDQGRACFSLAHSQIHHPGISRPHPIPRRLHPHSSGLPLLKLLFFFKLLWIAVDTQQCGNERTLWAWKRRHPWARIFVVFLPNSCLHTHSSPFLGGRLRSHQVAGPQKKTTATEKNTTTLWGGKRPRKQRKKKRTADLGRHVVAGQLSDPLFGFVFLLKGEHKERMVTAGALASVERPQRKKTPQEKKNSADRHERERHDYWTR